MSTPPAPTPPSPGSSKRWVALLPVLGGLFLLFIAIVIVLVIVIRGLFGGEPSEGTPLPVTKIAPSATPPTSPVIPPAVECQTIISSDDVQVTASIPLSLTIGERSFVVETVIPADDAWRSPEDDAQTAAWICGTIVNYVIELGDDPENGALLNGLRPGDEMRLLLSNGMTLIFQFTEQRQGVDLADASAFTQFDPRLTLLLQQEDGTWQVVTANFFAESGPAQPDVGTPVQPGQLAQIGQAQVTVLKGHTQSGAGSSGTMYYLVEYSVANAGDEPLNSALFDMQLKDGVGNVYLPSPEASMLGENGPLSGEIDPGEKATGTAGYLVPTTLTGPTLVWHFKPRPTVEGQVRVALPYVAEAQPTAEAPAQASVNVSEAFISDDGTRLIIEGQVSNVGGTTLTVAADDVLLSSSDGMGDLFMAAPPLPWVVEPGQTRIIELQYDRPDASAAVFILLGYSFEIGGLE